MPSYKRQSSGSDRKRMEKSKKSQNTVKRTLSLCTTLYVGGGGCVLLCVVILVIFSMCVDEDT